MSSQQSIPSYNQQRSKASPGTFISPQQGGYANVPGIYDDAQIEAWRKVTDAVHAKGSYIFCQLWALGRTANKDVAKAERITITSSSDIPLSSGHGVPIPLTVEQIKSTIQDYVKAAQNAIEAGFDGVELHGANGYLIDQFLQDKCNRRTDQYGGSIENRSRFGVEAIRAVADAIGADRTAIRFSPWSAFNGMRMGEPIPQFSDIIKELDRLGLAYLHLVESRIAGNADVEVSDKLQFAYDIWTGPFLIAGGFRPDSARRLVDEEQKSKNIVIMFGRYFISTPDLPFRVKSDIELNNYDRGTFYTPKHPHGYIDYDFSAEFLNAKERGTAV